MENQNHHVLISFIGGLVPALLWLWFWMKEAKERREPRMILALTFILGMSTVIFVLPFEQLGREKFPDSKLLVIIWAAMEEMIKYSVVALVALKRPRNQPIDFPVFMIVAALGFAAMENTLFLISPITSHQFTAGLLTGNLRFLGATLLHAVSSALIGIGIGLSFTESWVMKKVYLFGGILAAVTVHTLFNLFIIRNNGQNFFSVFAFLWIVSVIVLLLFEKLRRMSAMVDDKYPESNMVNTKL